MKVRDLLVALQSRSPDADVVIVLDALDVEPTDVEIGTTPDNEECVFIMTNDLQDRLTSRWKKAYGG